MTRHLLGALNLNEWELRLLLERAASIETDARRHGALKAVLPLLRSLHNATDRRTDADRDLNELTTTRAALEKARPQLEAAIEEARRTDATAGDLVTTTASTHAERQQELADMQGEAKAAQAQLDNHSNVNSAKACPLCASNLNSDDAKTRVAQHYDALRAALSSLRNRERDGTEQLELAKSAHENAVKAKSQTRSSLDSATKALSANEADHKQCTKDTTEKQKTRDAANAERESLHHDLPDDWTDHAAVADLDALARLAQELADLSGAPQALADLTNARNESKPAQARLDLATRQLAEIPEVAHPADRSALQEAVDDAEAAVSDAESTLSATTEAIGAMKAKLERRQTLATRHDAAALTAARYKRLAEAFGPKHLQARVLREAQVRVATNANRTLSQLTNGGWSIHLDDAGDELTVLAKSPLGHQREFDYLSGGERFRIALALAVGVGQTVSGGRSVRSLLVDEGFGALDDTGRALMVEELHRLRETVLDGGRVVVVAHQDDVKDQFDYRFEITKPIAGPHRGRAQVLRSTPDGNL